MTPPLTSKGAPVNAYAPGAAATRAQSVPTEAMEAMEGGAFNGDWREFKVGVLFFLKFAHEAVGRTFEIR